MREMKLPKPGTNMATSVAPSTMAERMHLNTDHLRCPGKRALNQLCAQSLLYVIPRCPTWSFADISFGFD